MRVWALLLALLFVSCSNDVPEENSSNGALLSSFSLDQIKPISFQQEAFDKGKWPEIKTRNRFTLSTCIKGISANIALPGIEFTIESNNNKFSVPTNNNGCLIWDYQLTYNYLNDEKFFEVPITITGNKQYPGSVKKLLAINPWQGIVLDLNEQSASHPVYSIGQSLLKKKSNSLFIDQFSIKKNSEKKFKLNKKNNKIELPYELTFRPYLTRFDKDKVELKESLSKGKFEVELEIIEVDRINGEHISISSGTEELTAKNGVVHGQITLNHNNDYHIKPNNQFILLIEVKAVGAPKDLGYFKGSITMNGFDHSKNVEINEETYKEVKYELEYNSHVDNESWTQRREFNSELKVKLSHLNFVDFNDDTSIKTNLPEQKFRKVQISGKILDPLSLRQATPIVDDEFVLHITSKQNKLLNKKNKPQELTIDHDGTFYATMLIP